MKTSLALLFSLVAFAHAGCTRQSEERVPCSLSDSACVSQAANDRFQMIVEGIPELLESSKPLRTDEFVMEIPNAYFASKGGKLDGLQDCTLTAKADLESSTYAAVFKCNKLVYDLEYVLDGRLANYLVKGSGNCKKTYSSYTITVGGPFKTVTKCGKEYMTIGNFAMTTDAVLEDLEVTGLSVADIDVCSEDAQPGEWRSVTEEDGKALEAEIRDHVMYSAMQKFLLKHVNTLLSELSIPEYFSVAEKQ